MPSIDPVPRGYRKCLDSDDHFFICDYLEIDHRMPDEVKLAEIISEIHRTSFSPTGQFGFHVTIYDGKLPLLYPSLYEDHRTVTPYLIHGNLWGQNIDTDPRTENIYIFDACAYYAHHKMAIGMWRVNHHTYHGRAEIPQLIFQAFQAG
ncbi:hypothetical protein N7536_004510 [Penicillium majusculum]|nr:hypothetical protein N7536_004510 [Penicillium majusculum]